MMTKPADYRARERALNTSQSFIVQAPAGSGKTELLTQRYLALLANVEQPEAILAITFTRKAASEMRERIIRSLNQFNELNQPEKEPELTNWRLSREVLKRNEKYQWGLTVNPQRMHILTIDSFYNSLIKRMPSLSGLGSDANTTENAEELYDTAAKRTLQLLSDSDYGQVVENLLLLLDGNRNKASRLLAEMLARRDQWQEHLVGEDEFQKFRDTIESSLEQLVVDELETVQSQFMATEIDELNTIVRFAIEQLRVRKPDSALFPDYLHTDRVFELSAPCLENLSQWQQLSQWILTKDSKGLRKRFDDSCGFPPKTAAANKEEAELFQAFKERAQTIAGNFIDRQSDLIGLVKLPATQFDETQWARLTDLISCLKLALAQLWIIFSERDLLDFQEVALRTSQALDDLSTDLGMILDYQIQHILIDEFQDTSQSQFQMLRKLVREWQPDENRTLFLVGDPMQSIYRFREADVGLFLKASNEGIENINLETLHLSVNFRSSNTIVDWVNDKFEVVFPTKEDDLRGAVPYSNSISFDQSNSGQVESLIFDDAGSEAEHLSHLIQQQLHTNPEQNIAILVRSRSHLKYLIPALQTLGLNFQATDIEELGKRPVITDLLMLFRALTDPTDRIAWLALLRAPYCGLLLEDLMIISGPKDSNILQNCKTASLINNLSQDGANRLAQLLATVEPWLGFRKHRSLADSLEGCWLCLDGPGYLSKASDLEAVQLFFDVIDEISIAGQLQQPELLHQAIEKLFAPPDPKGDPRIQIMTIHKSKGLQFDMVILPNLNGGSGKDNHRLLRWMTVPDGLLMAPISFSEKEEDSIYKFLHETDKSRNEYERNRLLYVACTRAKSKLVLSTSSDLDDDDVPKPKAGTFLKDIWPCILAEYKLLSVTESADSEEEEEQEYLDNRLWRHNNTDSRISTSLIASPTAEHIDISQADANKYSDDSLKKRAIGIVTHRWLEHIANDLESWNEARLVERTSIIAQQLQTEGLALEELDAASKMVLKHLVQTLECDMGRFILSSHTQAASEVALERKEQNQTRYYVIDRTFIDSDGVRWIIDYKTSTHEGANVEEFLLDKHEQYTNQLNNYASLYAELETRPIKLVIYFTQYQKHQTWDWVN